MTTIAFAVYDGMTSLDAVGPLDILRFLPEADPIMVSVKGDDAFVTTDSGWQLGPSTALDAVTAPDVVVVPGGPGTADALSSDLVPWLTTVHASTRWTTSVCSGSLLLGAAGLLQGIAATSHFAVVRHLAAFGATPTDERVIINRERRVITAAGVSAGIDMALRLAEELTDQRTARAVQLITEYDPQPPHSGGRLDNAAADVVARAIELGQLRGAIPADGLPGEQP